MANASTQIEGAAPAGNWWDKVAGAFGEGVIDVMRKGFDSIDFGDDEPTGGTYSGSPAYNPYTPYPPSATYYDALRDRAEKNPMLLAGAVLLGAVLLVKLAK